MATFTLDVVKPDGPVLSEAVDEVVIPGALGMFGVLPGHAPMLAQLGVGAVTYKQRGQEHAVAVEGGFCEVRPDRVTVLAERAERADQIDLERAERARRKAAEHLASIEHEKPAEEIDAVRRKLRRAEVRLETVRGAGRGPH